MDNNFLEMENIFSFDEEKNNYGFYAGSRSTDDFNDFNDYEDFDDEDFSEENILGDEDLLNIETIDEETFFHREKSDDFDEDFLIPEDFTDEDFEDLLDSDDIGEDVDDDFEYDR